MLVHLTNVSGNAKIGPIPVSTSSADTCPAACPFRAGGGCYADYGPLTIHWRKISAGQRGASWGEFVAMIDRLPVGQPWRHNQAGDLPGKSNRIDRAKLRSLVRANTGKRGWTYTHKPLTEANVRAIREANDNGFCVNVSANDIAHAVSVKQEFPGLPVACVLPADTVAKVQTVDGVRIVTCPATLRDGVTCADCMLCQRADRDFVIGFPAHGSGKKKAENAAGRIALSIV